MTRAAIAFLALASCAPSPTLARHEQAAVENFVNATCREGEEQSACLEFCADEFWHPDAAVHRDICIRLVTGKFTGEA